ncbi:MAG: hypothetical protein JJT76_05610 [Clostridiaceae bacterium]|nr:hypothetical protein [Clostridiaceae bacterium]
MLYGYILIFSLVMVLIGYSIGRRMGIKEGIKKSMQNAAINFKIQYYNHKKCPICANKYKLKPKKNREEITNDS